MRETLKDCGLLWLRLLMGAGMASHGFQKVFGGIMPQVVEGVAKLGLPGPPTALAWAASLFELVGGVLLALGLLTRVAALFVGFTMGVAAFVAHAADPFQVKELALAYLVMAVTLLLTGPGRYSLDHAIAQRMRRGGGRSGGGARAK